MLPLGCKPSGVCLWPRVPSWLPSAGAPNVTAPNPYCGSSARGRAVTERPTRALCARATSRYPPPVLRQRRAAQRCAPV